MARVTVVPEQFALVLYDAATIAAVAAEVADRVGFPAEESLRIEVDERTPLGRAVVSGSEPVTIAVESGAFEDPKRPRHLSERRVADVVGRLLLRVLDRRRPGWADAPPDEALSLAEQVAWDAWCVGRCERLGLVVQKERRRYHFRIRHGFTDTADEAFERLWAADDLTWADIVAVCAATAAARPDVPGAGAVRPGRGR
jgi:hypothetical protein